jgi:hypothetical protein
MYICFIKPNTAAPFTSFEIKIQDLNGAPFKIVRQVAGDALPEGNSGATTAQTSVEVSVADMGRLAAVAVTLDSDEVRFTAQDLQLNVSV